MNAALLTLIITSGNALSSKSASRRNFFKTVSTVTAASTATSIPFPAFALDMDAFMNSAIQQDVKKEITDDERTCKYAAPGRERGEACVRAGMSTASKSGKGGVDAFGNIDRGDFVRCVTTYPMVDGQYVKTVTCQ